MRMPNPLFVRRAEVESPPFNAKESREFESPSLRQRVPISGDTPLKSPKCPPQRPYTYKYGRGENHSRTGYRQLPAKISVGEFGATVWDFRHRPRHVGSEGALSGSFLQIVSGRSR
jgi:hypothetical protein